MSSRPTNNTSASTEKGLSSGSGSGKPVHVSLVAGPDTLRNLGPVVRHVIVGLLDQPLPVTLVCPLGADIDGIPAPPVQVIRYDITRLPFFRSRAIESLVRQVDQCGISLLHALDADAASLTRTLAAGIDVDYVVGAYSLHANLQKLEKTLPGSKASRGDQTDSANCRAILAASEPVRQGLLNSRSVDAGTVHLLRPGVHLAGRATCFLNPDHVTAIIAAGEFDSAGSFSTVLKAFAKTLADRRECVFFLVGNGRAERPLRRLADKLDLTRDLTFVDRQKPDELKGLLKAADIFIAPVPSDRVEIELLSAMAGGVPTLAAGAGASDFIIPDKTALIYAAGDAGELAAKLAALMDNHPAAGELAESALAHLRENHSPSKMVTQLVDLYQSIAGKKRQAQA